MTHRGRPWLVAALLLATPASAQEPPQSTGPSIDLFFDCPTGGCGDLDFLRREVPFVNWMRDREDADLHVLVTSQATGGGGRLFTLAFLGLRSFIGEDHELTHTTAGDATPDEQRRGIVDRLKLGLVRYVLGTAAVEQLHVTYDGVTDDDPQADGADTAATPSAARDDPWDYWVLRLNASGNANGESTSTFSNLSGRISANRTTEAWKLDVGANFFRRNQEFEFVDADGVTQRVTEKQEDWGASSSVVRSIGERWAIGVRAEANSSTRFNQDLAVELKPGVEFNFFPYAESSRRSLTLQYLVGPNHFRYDAITIFGETEETRLQQSLTARLSLFQPWGRWSTAVTGAQYLHNARRSNLTISGNLNVRLFRGFSVFASANYQWLRDQLYLSAAGATTEQVLLRQRQLETSYRYFYNFGIEYRFGSIFNNVVNPRFGGGGGGGEVFFF